MFSLALATESIVLSGKKGNARVQLSSCRTAVELGFGFLRQDGFKEHLKKKKNYLKKCSCAIDFIFSFFVLFQLSVLTKKHLVRWPNKTVCSYWCNASISRCLNSSDQNVYLVSVLEWFKKYLMCSSSVLTMYT